MAKISVRLVDRGTIYQDTMEGVSIVGDKVVEVNLNQRITSAIRGGLLEKVETSKTPTKAELAAAKKAEEEAAKKAQDDDAAALAELEKVEKELADKAAALKADEDEAAAKQAEADALAAAEAEAKK